MIRTLRFGPALLAAIITASSGAVAQPVFDAATVGAPRSGMPGELFRPVGSGPFPAMIVLSGCDGVGPHYRNWARRLRSWGYAALVVDSFTSRGVSNVCGRGREVDPNERAQDAFRAAAWLRLQPFVEPGRIGLIGFSHGGWSVLKAVLGDAVSRSGQPPFAAAVAYYPGCESPRAPLATDTLIEIGDADDWTPAARCRQWVDEVERSGHSLDIRVHPGARHGFDTRTPIHTYIGHRLGGDPAAAAEAEAEVRGFLATRLIP